MNALIYSDKLQAFFSAICVCPCYRYCKKKDEDEKNKSNDNKERNGTSSLPVTSPMDDSSKQTSAVRKSNNGEGDDSEKQASVVKEANDEEGGASVPHSETAI